MKIVVLDGYTENPGDLSWAALEELGELVVYDRTPESCILDRIADAEIVCTNKTPLSEKTLKKCRKLKYIGILATGYNIVDVKAAAELGIAVTNIPTYGTDAVAQYVIALLLELCHHIGEHSRMVKEGEWTACEDWCFWRYPLMELAGKTLGIIGYGRIGRKTAEIARALGMQVVAYDGGKKARVMEPDVWVEVEDLFSWADVISLNCPLLPSTEGLINWETIRKMKDGVIILNTARGQLIVEKDLREALECGKVGAAALDVVSEEPIRGDNPLLDAPNVVITPHIAWASRESRQRLMDIAVENIRAFLNGMPQNLVSEN